ncbi:MAG: hypothetical protein MJK18_10730 [Bdellovibrionales bacterium]|nr:hypothetical protein [Bdellovibrionales bacterium]
MTSDIGCKPIKSGLSKYGVSVDVSVGILSEVANFPEIDVNKIVTELWENRIDTLGLKNPRKEEFRDLY